MIINGEEMPNQKGGTLLELLEREGYDISRIAVEKNGEIITKSKYDTEILCDSDRIEIVSFVGGG